jgi:DNA primase
MIAALSAGHLCSIQFPATLRRLYVARDNDPAGDNAAARLAERAQAAGIEAITLSPSLGDFNDDLRAFGVNGLRESLRWQLASEDGARFMEGVAGVGAGA